MLDIFLFTIQKIASTKFLTTAGVPVQSQLFTDDLQMSKVTQTLHDESLINICSCSAISPLPVERNTIEQSALQEANEVTPQLAVEAKQELPIDNLSNVLPTSNDQSFGNFLLWKKVQEEDRPIGFTFGSTFGNVEFEEPTSGSGFLFSDKEKGSNTTFSFGNTTTTATVGKKSKKSAMILTFLEQKLDLQSSAMRTTTQAAEPIDFNTMDEDRDTFMSSFASTTSSNSGFFEKLREEVSQNETQFGGVEFGTTNPSFGKSGFASTKPSKTVFGAGSGGFETFATSGFVSGFNQNNVSGTFNTDAHSTPSFTNFRDTKRKL